jgi:ABC-type polysaccharide/polyol phosphate transport system ATPase subunit
VEACDFLIWIENGKVKKIGPPAEILPLYDDANDGMEKLNQN